MPFKQAAGSPAGTRVSVATTHEALPGMASEWDALAIGAGSPFLTAEWLMAWWEAYGTHTPVVLTLRDDAGRLRAGAFCRATRFWLHAPANPESGSWDVVAADEMARAQCWRALARLGPSRLQLAAMIENSHEIEVARRALRAEGFRVYRRGGPSSPYLVLPETWEALLRSVSRNLRSQVGARLRRLERAGELRFRTVTGGPELASAIDALLRVEHSGWKQREGTSILSDPRSEALYRSFAVGAAERGWLRLQLLELDGDAIAADYGCSFAGTAFLLKTGFDERYAALSPGLVLRAAVLRAAIEEGCRAYDFLGGADGYKLRWGAEIRERVVVRAYSGLATLPETFVDAALRPAAKRLLAAARRARERTRPA
jgi:CelD/BcsL family acetyltransferase involved in cellulose biosynthesis